MEFFQQRLPIVQAPMAGISTVALAAAVSNSGGLGFLAGALQKSSNLDKEIEELQKKTREPFGVNLFVPEREDQNTEGLHAYQQQLSIEENRYDVGLGDPVYNDDEWDEKLAILSKWRVPYVSFTFGCPDPAVIRDFQAQGTKVIVMITNPDDAESAARAGADALSVQGFEAGGHQSSFDILSKEQWPLKSLLMEVQKRCQCPLIAAGGLMTAHDVREVLDAGAIAAQLGTAFLRTPESGANEAYKEALITKEETVVTRAITGRRARGLLNRFISEHDHRAPGVYPHVHHMTKPIRTQAAKLGDPEGMSLWAGTGFKKAESESAAVIVKKLSAFLDV